MIPSRRAVLSSAKFNPAGLSGLLAWFAADRLPNYVNDDPVGEWTDLSGRGKHATATATTRPLFKTNIINGLPGILFDGINDVLITEASPNGAHTVAFVAQLVASTVAYNSIMSYTMTLTPGAGNGRGSTHYIKSNLTGAVYLPNGNSSPTAGYDGLGTYVAGTPYVFTLPYPAGAYSGYKNGVVEGSSSSPPCSDLVGMFLGAEDYPPVLRYSNIYLFEVVVYNRALANAERLLLERYLGAKYAISVA